MALKDVFNIFKTNESKKVSSGAKIYQAPGEVVTKLNEQFKSLVTPNEFKKFLRKNDIGVPHIFDFNTAENLYKKYGLITAITDKIVDFTLGPGISIRCEDERGSEILNTFIDDSSLNLKLRPALKDGILKGAGFMEVAEEKKNVLIKPINANSMYVNRNDVGEVKGFNQYFGSTVKSSFDADKVNPFKPEQIMQININQVGDSAYGVGNVYPGMEIINNFLSSQKSLHTLMHRKAGAPIHVKIGDTATEDIPSDDDITSFGKTLQVMNEKTEWVTGPNVEMKPLDFGNVGQRFEAILDNDFLLISYAFQVPEVLMGKGNIPEGLAKVQMDGFERKITSLQEEIGYSLKRKIFDRVLKLNNLDLKYKIVWGQPSQEDKLERIGKLKDVLSVATLSKGLHTAVEKDIAQTMDYDELEIEQINLEAEEERKEVQAVELGQKVAKQQQGRSLDRQAEDKESILKVPGQRSRESIKRSVYYSELCSSGMKLMESSKQMKVSEWVNYNLEDVEEEILAVLAKDKFDDLRALNRIELKAGYLTKAEVETLRGVLKEGFTKDLSMEELEVKIKKEVNIKDLKAYNREGVEDRVVMKASVRVPVIARTETVRVTNEGMLASYRKKDVEKVRWVASLGERTCPQCESLNGKILNAVNPEIVPPAHAMCRCVITPTGDFIFEQFKTNFKEEIKGLDAKYAEKTKALVQELKVLNKKQFTKSLSEVQTNSGISIIKQIKETLGNENNGKVGMLTDELLKIKKQASDAEKELAVKEALLGSRTKTSEVKDVKLSMTTGPKGKGVVDSEILTGRLKAMIIDCDSPVQLKVILKNHPGLKIYDNKFAIGSYYVVPATDTTTDDNKRFTYTQGEWTLNDVLTIEAKGKANSKVNITFRLD